MQCVLYGLQQQLESEGEGEWPAPVCTIPVYAPPSILNYQGLGGAGYVRYGVTGAHSHTQVESHAGVVAARGGGGGYSVGKRVPTAVRPLESGGCRDPRQLKKAVCPHIIL